jgi:hypothetical protein
MALTAYTRFRFLWGAVDFQNGSNSPYGTTQTANLGTSATTGIGARRAVLGISRGTGIDIAECHFDFLNMTAGAPDDTWTTTDYSTLETALTTWWNSVGAKISGSYKLATISWYKIGNGITPPNPNVRQVVPNISATGAFGDLPAQVACSITFRTASRKSWGRTYLPLGAMGASTDLSGGRWSNSYVDAIANATHTLVTSAASNDFYLVVWSHTKNALLNVESVEVDNVPDVVRRRRFKAATYKKILP